MRGNSFLSTLVGCGLWRSLTEWKVPFGLSNWDNVLLPDGACHVLQWTSKFTRKLVKGSLGGEAYAFSEMIDHMALLKKFYVPFSHISPGSVGMEYCESLFTHLKNRKMVTEKYLVRHFVSIQQLLGDGELENVYWLPGVENPADGLTKLRSEMGPIMTLLETGRFQPGILRPLKGLASSE